MSFSNKVVIVTGASSGIGAAIAILFCKEAANVVLVGRNTIKLNNISEKCAKVGKKPLTIKADVAVDEEDRRIVSETIKKFGRLDVLVNNAGYGAYGSLLEGNLMEAYDGVMSVNTRAVINITAIAVPYLIESKGNIINISSVAARAAPAYPKFLPYSISKAGLDQFTRGAALELAPLGVRVNSVNPGPVVTDFLENSSFDASWDDLAKLTPLQRASTAEEIADLVVYLAGDKARGITGSIVVTDNGYLLTR